MTKARKLIDQGDKLRAESDKLWAEARKLRAEARKLRAEEYKLWAGSNKLRTESDKLRTESGKLWSEADKLRAESFIADDRSATQLSKLSADTEYMGQATKALLLAIEIHEGQVDRQGMAYIEHPRRVGEAVAHLGDEYEAAGYLHDAVEDSEGKLTLDGLRKLDFPESVVQAVDSVTKREGETYAERVARAGRDKIGRAVKLADMRDNLRPGGPESLYKRYRKGIATLEGL